MKFLDGRETKIEVRRLAKESRNADLVVAFWGAGAIEELGLDERAGPTNIICNLESGATNPQVISDLQKLGAGEGPAISVRQNDRLHSKIYLFDDAVIIGSSNASTNGLAFEGGELTHSMEANVLSHDVGLIRTTRNWIDRLSSREISPADIARARAAWKKRRAIIRLPRDQSQSILETIRREPSTLAQLPIFLVIYHDELSSEAAQHETALQQTQSKKIGVFENWADLPAKGILLTFKATNARFRWDDAWERRGKEEDHALANGATIQVVWKTEDVFGKIPYRPSELKIWGQIYRAAMARPGAQIGSCFYLPISEVIATLLPDQPQSAAFNNDVWKSIAILEAQLKAERGRTVTLGRTRLKIKRVGEVRTVADLVLKKKPSVGFRMLVERDLLDQSFEALALKYPQLFDPYVRQVAEERLQATFSERRALMGLRRDQ